MSPEKAYKLLQDLIDSAEDLGTDPAYVEALKAGQVALKRIRSDTEETPTLSDGRLRLEWRLKNDGAHVKWTVGRIAVTARRLKAFTVMEGEERQVANITLSNLEEAIIATDI